MIIQLLDGIKYDIGDYSLKRLYHHIPSISMVHNTTTANGRGGLLFLDSQYGERIITVELLYQATGIFDYYLLRDKVNALFTRPEPYYIVFKNEPYKRWLVRVNNNFELPPNQQMEAFTIEFTCENIFSESIGTTLEMQNNKEWDVGLFAWNDTITWDDDLSYTFTNKNFNVKNLGNVDIDPREHELIVTIKGDFPNGLTMINNTTEEVYQYNGKLTTSDTLMINGIRTLKNGISDFGSTNKKLITLRPGENNMTISGGTMSSISFNFRFLYK
ncbi:distal tail protein Dit [Ureibacillus sp. FSL W8-0352]|uniref:distal tail protein Dit n=1 Tax=Ureibacillus sp. FSL W8-0352 TaxID=2954596 RepID=UPI0030F4C0A4